MSASLVPYQRKRRCLEQSPDDSTEPQLKRPKHCSSPSPSVPPVHYLDTLSKVWLTREALSELDRRTRPARPGHQRRPQNRRPLTRGYHAELRSKLHSTRTSASDFVQQCTPKTVKELKLFAKRGGPDLLDLRGYPGPAHPFCYTMSSTQSSRRHKRGKRGSVSTSRTPTTTTNTTITKVSKASGSDDPNFHQRMIDNGIYPKGYEFLDGRVPPKPEEWKEMEQMLVERRASLSPSTFPEEEYDKFVRADDRVTSENKAMKNVIPMIQGIIQDERCVDGPDIPLSNLANMLTGTARKPKPDVWYGARHEQIQPPSIRSQEELGKYIVPSITASRPCAPNFFVEAKGPGASTRAVLDQACFDGAFGARGMHKLLTYGQTKPKYDNKAHTLSATYHAGQLKMYAHHASQPNGPGTEPEYYMNQLKAWAMTSDRETLVKGMTAFRNGVDWAENQRNTAIEHAKAVANGLITNDDDDNDREEVEDSVDEDDDDGDEEDDGEEYELNADPILSSLTSESPFSIGQSTSRRSRTARQESDTSADEPDRRTSKRPMREKPSRQKRRGGPQSSSRHDSSSATSQQVDGWVWKDGAFLYYHGQTAPLKSQSTPPTDAWVYYEFGWPDGGGKKWRWLSPTGQALYQ